jgi:hypothetical protein
MFTALAGVTIDGSRASAPPERVLAERGHQQPEAFRVAACDL